MERGRGTETDGERGSWAGAGRSWQLKLAQFLPTFEPRLDGRQQQLQQQQQESG